MSSRQIRLRATQTNALARRLLPGERRWRLAARSSGAYPRNRRQQRRRWARRWSRLCPAWIVYHRRLARRDLNSRRGAAEVERGPEARRRLEGVEQRSALDAEQRRVDLRGDGGIA